jgi:uncharacterized protein YuzE
MMKHRYLEVTFRNGRPLAAYLYLPRNATDKSVRTVKVEEGLLIDYAADGRAIGIEITSPSRLSLAALNRALTAAGQNAATVEEVAPLAAA